MDNAKRVLERTDPQNIREFLLTGCGQDKIERGSYEQRLAKTREPLMEFLRAAFREAGAREKAEDLVWAALGSCEDVYFEFGMHAGARIVSSLTAPGLQEPKNTPPRP